MAVAGSMTTAYYMRLVGGVLDIKSTTYPMRDCDPPAEAVAKIRRGERAIVSGGDAFRVRELLTGKDAHGGEVAI